jgi:hypothetical protein
MSDAAPSLGGRPTARLPHYAVADRVSALPPATTRDSAVETVTSPSNDPIDYSGVNYNGLADASAGDAPATDGVADVQERWGYERGGYGGSAATVAAERDGADLTDLSHSLGDGARYAVDVGHARGQAETPAARAAKLRLRQALQGVRRVCAQAMRQRMHTEMADLAAQIRKMHDRDGPAR